jgi:hypothetical protein
MAQTHSTTSKHTFKHLTTYKRGMIAALHSEGNPCRPSQVPVVRSGVN